MTKLWTQTIVAPVVSSFLFIVVFGLSLGGRIKQIDGVDYDAFIVPGLLTMAMVQAAYSNNASSVFQARFDRYLNDVLAAPMRNWEVNLGLSLGGAVRALLIAAALAALALPVTGAPVHEPLVLALAVAIALVHVLLARRDRRDLRRDVRPPHVRQQHHHPAADVPGRGLLLRGPPALAVAGDLARQSDLLPRRGRALRVPGTQRRQRRARRSASPAALAAGGVAWSSWLFATGKRLKA